MAKKKKHAFAKWIEEYGVLKLAEECGVSQTAVDHWRLGRNHPRLAAMRKIETLSRGKMTVLMILQTPTGR